MDIYAHTQSQILPIKKPSRGSQEINLSSMLKALQLYDFYSSHDYILLDSCSISAQGSSCLCWRFELLQT